MLCILYVEDNEDNAYLLKMRLKLTDEFTEKQIELVSAFASRVGSTFRLEKTRTKSSRTKTRDRAAPYLVRWAAAALTDCSCCPPPQAAAKKHCDAMPGVRV